MTRQDGNSIAIDRDIRPLVPTLLRATIVCAFVLPASMIFSPLGAMGYVAALLALLMFGFWVLSAVWGLHDPVPFRHPGRVGLAALWLATIASYLQIAGGPADATGRAAADRWILALAAMSAVMLMTTEFVRTRAAAFSLARVLVASASVCASIALCQFVFRYDPLTTVRGLMFGMVDNGGSTTFQDRGLLTRVSGNMFSPIELGTVATMVLPIAVWRALFDDIGRRWVHWFQCVLILLAAVVTISRSAILGLVVVCVVVVPFLPKAARRWAYLVVPLSVVGVFMMIPGLIATMRSLVLSGSDDPSLANRLNNYPRVQAMVEQRPFVGSGPATYIPDSALEILDNQYLNTAVEMGLIGVVALALFFILPACAAVGVAVYVREPVLRLLAAAVAGACIVGAISSATFDSLSFPVFRLIFPVFAGLSGAVWLIAQREPPRVPKPPPRHELTKPPRSMKSR